MRNKAESKLTASILEQDQNPQMVEKNVYLDETKYAHIFSPNSFFKQ